jgi:S-adenosylmethionine-diacylglycerol 3-amino-3-carboxypropyl transferase
MKGAFAEPDECMGNVLLKRAAHQRPANTRRGALERLFTLMFSGFVYNQIWEDPGVDLEALSLGPNHRLITIASGGCNVLNYLAAGPERIIAVDLNPNHVALTRLKLQALTHLPDYDAFFSFFGIAKDKSNRTVFDNFLAERLDSETRRYWDRRIPLRGRRINMFARNLYRYGLLGRFIGVLHAIARLNGKRLQDILHARTPEEQRALFEATIAPLFDNRFIRFLSRMPVSYYGLGIPPAQYDELVAAAADGNPVTTLRERVERLACDFPISENYFAWQAFGRGYDTVDRIAVPPYLRAENYELIKSRVDRVDVHHASMIDFLAEQPESSLHRYVLLDAQDWMTPEQMTLLWSEIDRTADRNDARVIFRTAGLDSPLPRKIPAELLAHWTYLGDESRDFHARDRSSIYGGFHAYVRRGTA